MKFENVRVMNFQGALYGMRNPKNSWNRIDSKFGIDSIEYCDEDWTVADAWVDSMCPDLDSASQEFWDKSEEYSEWLRENGILRENSDCIEYAFIGPNDMRLAQNLIKAGPEHRKFMRQIFVSVDITAPLYW